MVDEPDNRSKRRRRLLGRVFAYLDHKEEKNCSRSGESASVDTGTRSISTRGSDTKSVC